MDTRYHVYFAGELQEGHGAAEVRANIAKLFNADAATLDKLFSGQMQAIKRNCDRATAAKYKAAIEKAGAKPIIRVAEASDPVAAPAPAQEQPSKPLTAAEKISALAAAAETPPPAATPSAPSGNTTGPGEEPGGISIAAAGSDVLRDDERSPVEAAEIDTSGLVLDAPTDRLAPETAPPPAAPDTSHLAMGEVGDQIPTLPRHETLLDPDTDSISLAPEGSDLSDCAPDAAATPQLDLSALDLAPAGSDVLDEEYRRRETARAPDTDHLALDD